MKGTLSSILIFAAGAAIGSAVTWKIVKTKYEQIAQEEIESVKKIFKHRIEEDKTTDEVEASEPQAPVENTPADDREVMKMILKPYVISPEEFGDKEDEGYESISLTYYADGVLTDDWDERVDDVEETVGTDSLTHFGEYEDDSVFVRNDELKADYEILLDSRNYRDVKQSRAHREDNE